MEFVNKLISIILCHLFGDYVLQSDYLAVNKGKDWYLLLVHSALYCIPFIIVFGLDSRALLIFSVHVLVDIMKARWKMINLFADQSIHYIVAMRYLV